MNIYRVFKLKPPNNTNYKMKIGTAVGAPLSHRIVGLSGNPGNSRAQQYNGLRINEESILNTSKYNRHLSINNHNNSGQHVDQPEDVKRSQELISRIRHWISVSADQSPGFTFTVLNYNVLAQDLIHENAYLYKNHNPRACLWETRWRTLYKEISQYNADIVCLQEVQESHLNDYYNQLKKLGYVGLFKKRTGQRPDGCALYYKQTLFNMIDNTTVEFFQNTISLDRENVAIIVRLAPKQQPLNEFVVATTHLLYNPRRMDVRLSQTQVFLAEIERFAYNYTNKYVPIIITGDFNSKPDSAVYKLIVNGSLHYEYLSNRTLTLTSAASSQQTGKLLLNPRLGITDNCQHYDLIQARKHGLKLSRSQELSYVRLRNSKSNIPRQPTNYSDSDSHYFSTGTLSHPFQLISAFKHVNGSGFEATTHQNEWITVDYIFYSGRYDNTSGQTHEDKLKLMEVYRIPTKSELENVKYIPNFVVGSDHLPLVTKFKLIL